MPTKIITDEKFLPTKNFTISKIFWNLFRGIFTFSLKWHKNIDHQACELTSDVQYTFMLDVRLQ